MNVLIVEDSATDTLLAKDSLSQDPSFRATAVQTLAEAMTALKQAYFEVVLLDLGLPDSQGLDTLHQVCSLCGPDSAIVVLTGNEDRTMAALALRSGAQDYLYKSHIANSEALRRCLIYAHERRRQASKLNALQRELDLARKDERRNEETAFWSELAQSSRMGVAGQEAGPETPLRDVHPKAFDELVRQYCMVLENSVDQRIRKVHSDISHTSTRIAWQLGEHDATPRDVVLVHVVALRQKMDESPSLARAMAYQEEGRLRIVEMMGYLATYYRWKASPPSNS